MSEILQEHPKRMPSRSGFIRSMWLYFRIRKLMSMKLYGQSLKIYRKLYQIFDEHGPSYAVFPATNLLYAVNLARVGDVEEAAVAFGFVLNQLNLSNEWWGWGYGKEDRNYLKYYLKVINLYFAKKKGDEFDKIAEAIELDYDELILDGVKRDFRRAFPLDAEYGKFYDRLHIDRCGNHEHISLN